MNEEFSAGGVVFRQTPVVIPTQAGIQLQHHSEQGEESQEPGSPIRSGMTRNKSGMTVEVLISQHSAHHGWVFPKGHVGDKKKNETPEEAALREVQEETGIVGEILMPLTPVFYWYVFEGEKRHKKVQYFVMQYVSGNTTDHDFEMEKVEWLPEEAIEERLTYPADKKAWEEAREMINKLSS